MSKKIDSGIHRVNIADKQSYGPDYIKKDLILNRNGLILLGSTYSSSVNNNHLYTFIHSRSNF